MYQVPHYIDNNKVFIVQRAEIEGRLEPEFYRPSIADLEKIIRGKSSHKLRDYALSVSGGATPKKTEGDKYYADKETGVPFLRVQNLNTDGTLSFDDYLYINKETHEGMLARSQVSEGDLLVKITGVGRMAIASVAPEGFIGNTNQHMVVVKTGNKEISKYLARYLNLDIIEKIASRHSTGGTRPALDYPSVKNLPIIEGIDFSPIDRAIELKKQKESEAQKLLDSIDKYILNELGITIPEIDASLENRLFFTSFKDVTGSRLDPYYKLYFSSNYKSVKYDSFRLGSITNICKGTALTSKDIIPGNIPVIAGGKSSPYSHNEANFDGNVITVSASGAYAGYVWYHQNPIFATDCSVISSKDESLVLTNYIAEVLKSIQSIIFRLQVGAAQPHVYPSDLMNIYIPSIPISQQKTIVNKAQSIRDIAKKVIEEGNSILENAKKEVEQMIIG